MPLGFDGMLFFTPLLRLAHELVAAGDWPLWTDRIGTGYPLVASTQVSLLYPPVWPLLVLSDPAVGLSAYLLLHAVVAGVGGYWLGRRAELSPRAAQLVAVICSASLPVVCLANRPAFLCAAAWGPWILGALVGWGKRPQGLALGVSLGLCAAVSLESAGLYLMIAVAAMLCSPSSVTPPRTWRDIRLAGFAFALFALPTIIPFLELLPWTDRLGDLGRWRLETHSLDLSQAVQLLAPGALGGLRASEAATPAQVAWLAGPLAGVACTALLLSLATRRGSWPLLAVPLVLAVLAAPKLLPFLEPVWTIPPLSMMRFPAKLWQHAVPLVALLCGMAVDRAQESGKRIHCVALGFVVILAVGLAWGGLRDGVVEALRYRAADAELVRAHLPFALGLSLTVCGALAAASFVLAGSALRTALVVIAATEAVILGVSAVDGASVPPSPVAAGILEAIPTEVPRISNYATSGKNALADPTLTREERARLSSAMGVGDALLGERIAIAQPWTGVVLGGVRAVDDAFFSKPLAHMDVFGADALLAGLETPGTEALRVIRQWPELGLALFAPPSTERARIASTVSTVASADAFPAGLTKLAENGAAGEVLVLESALPVGSASLLEQPAPQGTATVTTLSPRSQELSVSLDRSGLVWTPDAFGPAWRVTIDGVDAQPVAVNGAFRGVIVPAGQHAVAWRHEARGVLLGLLAGLLAAVALGVDFALSRRRF